MGEGARRPGFEGAGMGVSVFGRTADDDFDYGLIEYGDLFDDDPGFLDDDDAASVRGRRWGRPAGRASRADAGRFDIGSACLRMMNELREVTDEGSLRRGRALADKADLMLEDPSCETDRHLGEITIGAVVRGTSPSARYDVSVTFDMEDGSLGECDCTCPAHRRGYEVCKHMAAVAMAFDDTPSRFAGFAPSDGPVSSHGLKRLMTSLDARERARGEASVKEAMLRSGTSDGDGNATWTAPGSVRLTPVLGRIEGRWGMQLRIGAGEEGSYVVKSMDALLNDLDEGAFRSYGRKLAFAHTPDMFEDRSRRLLELLERLRQTRRAADLQNAKYGHLGEALLERRLVLAPAEAAQVLDLYAGARVGLVIDSWHRSQPTFVDVADAPEATPRVGIERMDGGYRLRGTPRVEATAAGERGVWLLVAPDEDAHGAEATRRIGRRFVRCSRDAAACADLLTTVCAASEESAILAADDAPLFARTILPRLMRGRLVGEDGVPSELKLLLPADHEVEYYLDRDERGLTCALKVRYSGAWTINVVPRAANERDLAPGRDITIEQMALLLVRQYFETDADLTSCRIARDDTRRIVDLFDHGLDHMHGTGTVYTTPAFDRMLSPRPPSVKVGLSVQSNLVEISPIADEVPPDEVGALLDSYRRRQRFHRLRDGRLLDLRAANLETLDRLAETLDLDAEALAAGAITMPGMNAFLLDGELDGDDVAKDASFAEYVDELRRIDPERYRTPERLRAELRPYQLEGYRWLRTLCDKGFGGILADEMGLGKTVQLIALMLGLHEDRADAGRPSLIVCPASLVYNWAAELAKFAPEARAVVIAGSKTARRLAIERAFTPSHEHGQGPTVAVTSYDLLRRDADDYRGRDFALMALDEAQAIKNHATKTAKAVKSVQSDHRIALTGTPIENRLSELWSLFDFLMPGLLGTYRRFHERYELPIAGGRAADPDARGRAAAEASPESLAAARRLQALVGTFILRRVKRDVLADLPDKMETTVRVRLEGEQRRLYAAHEQRLRRMLEHGREAGADGSYGEAKIRLLAEMTKLRQLCCDPRLLYEDAKDASAKLAALEDLVAGCMEEGKKALVFSQFTAFLDLIAARLDSRGVGHLTIDGSTPKRRRLELVDRFNHDDTPVFLISLKAGNTGLNLVGASVVIHADPWWNAAAQDQATDRAHRIGQTRDVDVYRIVAEDTIEERILDLQETKSALARRFTDASALAEAAPASIASLSREDLLALLG